MKVVLYERPVYHESFEKFRDNLFASEMRYMASELNGYGFNDARDLELAIERAIGICQTAGLSVRQNFRQIFISQNETIIIDWCLSELGKKLILLNANADNPFVARLQIELLGNL